MKSMFIPAPDWQRACECTRIELIRTDPGESLAIPAPEMATAAENGDAIALEG